MKIVFVVYHADIWGTFNSYRTIGVADSLKKAIKLAKKDAAAMSDISTKHGTILIYKYPLNTIDEEILIFNSNKDCDLELLTE